MHIVQHASRHADDQDGQLPLGLVLDSPRHIDDHTGVQLDLLGVQYHAALASDHIVELVSLLVVVQFGVLDLDMVDIALKPLPTAPRAFRVPGRVVDVLFVSQFMEKRPEPRASFFGTLGQVFLQRLDSSVARLTVACPLFRREIARSLGLLLVFLPGALGHVGHEAVGHLGLLAQALQDGQAGDGHCELALPSFLGELSQPADLVEHFWREWLCHGAPRRLL